MALTFKLSGLGTDVPFTAAVGGGLRGQQWFPKSATPIYGWIPPYLVENVDIRADRTSDNDLAATLQALDNARQRADLFRRDPGMDAPTWLYAKMDGETGERRAYVRQISAEWRSNQISGSGLAAVHDALLRVGIERHPYWEGTASQSISFTTAEKSGAAIRWDCAGPIYGDVEGRLWRFMLRDLSGPGLIDRVWFGLRSRRKHYDHAGRFPYLWEIENAALAGTDCSAPTPDATASPGGAGNTKRVVSFATTPGWAKRLTMKKEDAGPLVAFETEATGLGFWLLRYKVDAGTTCEVQLRWGGYDCPDDIFVRGPVVSITNTSWDYAECGICWLPVTSLRYSNLLLQVARAAVQLWARRTAGAGSLHLDCFSVIPIDEGWLIAKGAGNITAGQYLSYGQTPDDLECCALTDIGVSVVLRVPDWSSWNFRLPPDAHTSDAFSIYGVIARSGSAVFTDPMKMNLVEYYPRFLNLRGAS